jgi:hypothetical protein
MNYNLEDLDDDDILPDGATLRAPMMMRDSAPRSLVAVAAQIVDRSRLKIDGESAASIKRQVVDARVGDVAKGWDDAQIDAGFAVLAAEVSQTRISDAARAAWIEDVSNAWRGPRENNPKPIIGDRDAWIEDMSNAWRGSKQWQH